MGDLGVGAASLPGHPGDTCSWPRGRTVDAPRPRHWPAVSPCAGRALGGPSCSCTRAPQAPPHPLRGQRALVVSPRCSRRGPRLGAQVTCPRPQVFVPRQPGLRTNRLPSCPRSAPAAASVCSDHSPVPSPHPRLLVGLIPRGEPVPTCAHEGREQSIPSRALRRASDDRGDARACRAGEGCAEDLPWKDEMGTSSVPGAGGSGLGSQAVGRAPGGGVGRGGEHRAPPGTRAHRPEAPGSLSGRWVHREPLLCRDRRDR